MRYIKLLFFSMITFVFLTIPMLGLAENITMEGESLPDVNALYEAIMSKNWPVVVSVGLMVLIWILRNVVKDRIPTKYLPWISLTIAVVSAISMRVSQQIESNHTWWHGLIQGSLEGFSVGLTAMGWWSIGGKKFLNIKNE